MIADFKCKETKKIFDGFASREFPQDIHNRVRRKLRMIHSAQKLDDLKIPPGNRLESLSGDRSGQYSIRINDQWRICFEWQSGTVSNVEIVDYH